jgi:hypothetical protein
LGLREGKYWEVGDSCIMTSFIIFITPYILLGQPNKRERTNWERLVQKTIISAVNFFIMKHHLLN